MRICAPTLNLFASLSSAVRSAAVRVAKRGLNATFNGCGLGRAAATVVVVGGGVLVVVGGSVVVDVVVVEVVVVVDESKGVTTVFETVDAYAMLPAPTAAV